MIFTALSPNTQSDDFCLACRALLNLPRLTSGPYPEKVKRWFQDFFDVKDVFLYESARTGLYEILKATEVGDGDDVLLQAFTCVAAVNPIKWAGAKPVFVDIDSKSLNIDLRDLEKKVTSETKAIIVQHTFGYPANISEIVDLAKGKGLFVIEDCAHTIGGELSGKKLGTFGDAGMFSLGRDKAISGSFGGVVISNNSTLTAQLNLQHKALNAPSKLWVIRQILYTITTYLVRELYDILSIGKAIHFIFRKSGITMEATTKGEKKSGDKPAHFGHLLPNGFARIALHQLSKLTKMNEHRNMVAKIYFEGLKKFAGKEIVLPEWDIRDGIYPLRFPLLVRKRDELMKFAKNRGVLLGDWYDTPVAPKSVSPGNAGYRMGSCPNAEKVCEEIVNLPLHMDISEVYGKKIIKLISQAAGI